ncbi:unnamed protein product [Rotaria socialis]
MTFSTASLLFSVAVDDFNNDARLDIVVATYDANSVVALLGYVAVDDLNDDALLNIAVANSDSDDMSALFEYGNGSVADQIKFSVGSQPQSVAAGDFNNDTQLDVVVANYDSGSISIFIGYGNGSCASQLVYSTGPDCYPYFVAVGDFNNDAIVDIVVVNQNSNDLGIFLGYGNGIFATVILVPLGYELSWFFNKKIMLDKFLLIRPAQLTCFVSICKRYVRTAPPVNHSASTEVSSSVMKEEKTAIDSTGEVFTFRHGPPPDIKPVEDLGPYEIRLQNIGCTNRRFDRIVVQRMKHSPNADEIIENLGSYDPIPNDKNEVLIALNLKRLRYWIGTEGVVINPWVQKLLGRYGFFPVDPADYVDAYRARKIAENRLRYPEKKEEEEKQEDA